jgi:hypothetical protein
MVMQSDKIGIAITTPVRWTAGPRGHLPSAKCEGTCLSFHPPSTAADHSMIEYSETEQ